MSSNPRTNLQFLLLRQVSVLGKGSGLALGSFELVHRAFFLSGASLSDLLYFLRANLGVSAINL